MKHFKLFSLLTLVLGLGIISFASFGDNTPTWEQVDEYKKLQREKCINEMKHNMGMHEKKEIADCKQLLREKCSTYMKHDMGMDDDSEANVFNLDYI